MRYPALAVANYFIDRATMDGVVLDHLKIQKLVYMAHGWCLAIFGVPLIDEPVQAWKYGPVIPSLYHQFKKHGNGPIAENGALINRWGGITVPSVGYDDRDIKSLLEQVWKAYSKYSGVQLSNITHLEGTPWHQAWNAAPGRKSQRIDDRVIAEHFSSLVRDDD